MAAYNTTEGHLQFHPREREDCGYVLTLGGTRVYIAGDSEPTPEMRSLEWIDIAFLPVNQPYTMTVDQAAEAVRALRPAIFYPYHYGEVEPDHRSRPAGARGGGVDRDAGSPDGVMRLRSERRGGSATLPLFSLLSAMRACGVGRERVDALVRKGGVVDNFS